MRKLDPEEQALWLRVAATIRPMSQSKLEGSDADRSSPVNFRVNGPASKSARPPSVRSLTLGETLDGSWEKKVRQGTLEPDQTLDLHGHNLDHAWAAIDRVLDRAWNSHQRVVLLVTGRERSDALATGRGRIRAAVRDWLAFSRHAPHIAAIRGAHRRHGGAGSLYVILRRR